MPFADCPSTITVSPFPGTVDICPQSYSANLLELNTFNACVQISTMNLSLIVSCLLTPSSEVGLAPASSLGGVRAWALIKGPVSQTLCP